MKRSVLIGLALLMGANSIATANSSRVTNIENQTADERGATRAELLADLKDARENLEGIMKNLDEAIGMRNFQAGGVLISAAITIGITFVKKKSVEVIRKNGNGQGMLLATITADVAYLYSAYQTIKQIENTYNSQQEVLELRDMATKMTAKIVELEKQVGAGSI
jgi:hypothetical protein